MAGVQALRNRRKLTQALGSVALCAVLLITWHVATAGTGTSRLLFPAPLDVGRAFYSGITTGEYVPHLLVTLYEVLCGFLIGSLIGFVLGVAIGEFEFLDAVLYPYIVAFQTVPKVAVAPLFVIWFGFGVESKVIITATILFFPLLTNTVVGLRSAPTEQIELLRAATASRWQIMTMARLPNSLPLVFAGLDIAIVLAVIGAIVGEFVGSQSGLGYLLLQKNFAMDSASVFAILIILSLIGLVFHKFIQLVGRTVTFWSDTARSPSNH